jgi:CrcB protein
MPDWLTGWANPLAVVLGGAAGAWCRYAISHWAARFHAVQTFPWHTFSINVIGSFALGLLAGWWHAAHPKPFWWFLLGTGFCGGFTTFSTFSVELVTMLEKDRTAAAVAYAAGSVAAGIMGAIFAMRMARG